MGLEYFYHKLMTSELPNNELPDDNERVENNEQIEKLCAKLRATVQEFGQSALSNAVMVGSLEIDYVSDIPYMTCPTIANETLGNVSYKVARFFENI